MSFFTDAVKIVTRNDVTNLYVLKRPNDRVSYDIVIELVVRSVEEGNYFDGRMIRVGNVASQLIVDVPA